MLVSIKKHTDTHTEQKKTRPQEAIEFTLIKYLDKFSFSINLSWSEGPSQVNPNWLLVATNFEAANFVPNITVEKKFFNFYTRLLVGHQKCSQT